MMEYHKLRAVYLKHYQKYHEIPPSFGSLAKQHFKRWCILLFLIGSGAFLINFSLTEQPYIRIGLMGFISGLYSGVILRDIGYIRAAVHGWSILEEIIDWDSVEQKYSALYD